jgi:hypothetical protein
LSATRASAETSCNSSSSLSSYSMLS